MNLSTQHIYACPVRTLTGHGLGNAGLPTSRFLCERAKSEARLGVRVWKFFMGEQPVDAPSREEIERLRRGVAEARLALAKAFGDDTEGETK